MSGKEVRESIMVGCLLIAVLGGIIIMSMMFF
jgi:hypothetical protein